MAQRAGVFGRLPRAAPDLTNTVVALVREAQAMLDQNMVDAWKSGGKVDGKGVDDDRLLRHMKKRRDQLDPSDPAWDEWNNNYIQYDFAIHESKMALKNDQGKISDAAMARFYKKWAGREDVQKDSEFYRSLLSRAAKWNAAAKARSSGRRAGNSAAAHSNWVNAFYKDHVQGAETATGYLLSIAKTYGAAPPSAQSLDDINPNSEAYGRFLDVISDGKSDDPNVQGLIDEATRAIRKTNPNFSWSQGNLNDLLDRGDAGIRRLKSESTSDSERNEWAKRREALRYEKTRIRQARANERIQIAADTYADDLDACAGNPYCARNVTQKFRDKLQKEAKNVLAGVAGGVNVSWRTQDDRTASALANTIRQVDDILAGKEVGGTAAAALGRGEADGTISSDYTIFDAAAGRDSAGGQLGTIGNAINNDKDKLDAGGWIMTTPRMAESGTQALDGNGLPEFDYVIYGPQTPRPDGLIAVPGVTMMTDQTRAATGPEGPTPITVTPTTFVSPSPPTVQYVSPDGTTLTPQSAANVRLFDGETEAVAPWVELHGVKGPDGKARTLYRTGNGVDVAFMFHELPPTAQDIKPNAAGQFAIPVTQAVDADNKPYLRADISAYVAGVEASRETLPSGNFVQGTYSSPGAASTAQAIASLFDGKQPNASTQADKYLREFQRGIEALQLTDPNRISGQRDYSQLAQTVNLHKQGRVGSMLGDAYEQANAREPKADGYLSQLSAAGFTVGRVGQGEIDRRLDLLTGIDAADRRLAERAALLPASPPLGVGGRGGMAFAFGVGQSAAALKREQEALNQNKKDVFNPTISVSNIKVPGLPGMFQPPSGVMPPQGVRGGVRGATPTPFPAPGPTTAVVPVPTPRPGPETPKVKPPKPPPEPRKEFKPPPPPKKPPKKPTPPGVNPTTWNQYGGGGPGASGY